MKTDKRFVVIAVNAVIFVALLGGLEFTARRIQIHRLGRRALVAQARMDRWTAWRNTPGYDRGDIHHDKQGFRHDEDVSMEKPANTVRIFFLGGSAAYGCEGQYRSMDPAWQRIYNRDLIDTYLQSALQQRHPERRWEVVNAAVNEFRMHQHLGLIYTQLLRYHPDLVIFMDGHNDMSGIMSQEEGTYDPFAATPHQAEFDNMVYPKSLRSLLLINTMWLRNNSVLFDVMYRKTLARQQEKAYGPGADPAEPVTSPVRFGDIPAAQQRRAKANLAQIDYYPQMAQRLFAALAHEGIPALFSMQPELILSPKPLTPIEAKFANYTRQISRRYITYMYEQMQPAISHLMAEAAQRDGFVFVDLGDTFRSVREKTFTDYCHMTPRGNQLIADRLYKAMEPALIPKLVASTAAPPYSASSLGHDERRTPQFAGAITMQR
ncbi:MAG TPA: SGNH/GDSL hydrolase family protein [Bryobacteraceae bacterium]|nr:SGNH/GDSL hydrolase family protein [Bryobacteraceae bacterium]